MSQRDEKEEEEEEKEKEEDGGSRFRSATIEYQDEREVICVPLYSPG